MNLKLQIVTRNSQLKIFCVQYRYPISGGLGPHLIQRYKVGVLRGNPHTKNKLKQCRHEYTNITHRQDLCLIYSAVKTEMNCSVLNMCKLKQSTEENTELTHACIPGPHLYTWSTPVYLAHTCIPGLILFSSTSRVLTPFLLTQSHKYQEVLHK